MWDWSRIRLKNSRRCARYARLTMQPMPPQASKLVELHPTVLCLTLGRPQSGMQKILTRLQASSFMSNLSATTCWPKTPFGLKFDPFHYLNHGQDAHCLSSTLIPFYNKNLILLKN